MKRVLLIGGSGFIGRNLACKLVDTGFEVTVMARHPFSVGKEYTGIQFILGNIFVDAELCKRATDYEYVIYLVCSIKPASNLMNCMESYGKDIGALVNVLENLKENPESKLLFISSGGTVYGNQRKRRIDENSSTCPINHYGVLKLTQEKILLMYNECYGMQNVIFRVANPYGMGQDRHSGIGAVTAFLDAVMCHEKITIYGDGENVRDFIAIEDVASLIADYLKCSLLNEKFHVYNIGTGIGTSLKDLIHMIEEITSQKAIVEYVRARTVDVKRNVLDISRIQELLGNTFTGQSLEKGISEYWKLKYGGQAQCRNY